MKTKQLLSDAKSAPSKVSLEAHREAILLLREKGYSWRDISVFLAERGIFADHTKIYRLLNKAHVKKRNQEMKIISAKDYENALQAVALTDKQRLMLKAHYEAPNRSITYTQLANAAGYENYQVANSQYGQLGKNIGLEAGLQLADFADSAERPGEKFYSSAIGIPNTYAAGEFQLIMHHELAKALTNLGWF